MSPVPDVVSEASKKIPTFGQWPATLIVVLTIVLGLVAWVADKSVDAMIGLTTEISEFRMRLGAGTEKIVLRVDEIGRSDRIHHEAELRALESIDQKMESIKMIFLSGQKVATSQPDPGNRGG